MPISGSLRQQLAEFASCIPDEYKVTFADSLRATAHTSLAFRSTITVSLPDPSTSSSTPRSFYNSAAAPGFSTRCAPASQASRPSSSVFPMFFLIACSAQIDLRFALVPLFMKLEGAAFFATSSCAALMRAGAL